MILLSTLRHLCLLWMRAQQLVCVCIESSSSSSLYRMFRVIFQAEFWIVDCQSPRMPLLSPQFTKWFRHCVWSASSRDSARTSASFKIINSIVSSVIVLACLEELDIYKDSPILSNVGWTLFLKLVVWFLINCASLG